MWVLLFRASWFVSPVSRRGRDTKKEAWELLLITVLRLWTAHLQVINKSPRRAIYEPLPSLDTGRGSGHITRRERFCLLSLKIEIVQISTRDNK